jgi:hypothetical protein
MDRQERRALLWLVAGLWVSALLVMSVTAWQVDPLRRFRRRRTSGRLPLFITRSACIAVQRWCCSAPSLLINGSVRALRRIVRLSPHLRRNLNVVHRAVGFRQALVSPLITFLRSNPMDDALEAPFTRRPPTVA